VNVVASAENATIAVEDVHVSAIVEEIVVVNGRILRAPSVLVEQSEPLRSETATMTHHVEQTHPRYR
jgi:hypothetical protein